MQNKRVSVKKIEVFAAEEYTIADSVREYVEVAKIKTLAEWGHGAGDVVDPFGSNQDVYNQCAEQIYNLVKAGLVSSKE